MHPSPEIRGPTVPSWSGQGSPCESLTTLACTIRPVIKGVDAAHPRDSFLGPSVGNMRLAAVSDVHPQAVGLTAVCHSQGCFGGPGSHARVAAQAHGHRRASGVAAMLASFLHEAPLWGAWRAGAALVPMWNSGACVCSSRMELPRSALLPIGHGMPLVPHRHRTRLPQLEMCGCRAARPGLQAIPWHAPVIP